MTIRVLTADPRGWLTMELLDAYTAGDPQETAYLQGMQELLATTREPFSRTQYEPGHFTASALVITSDRSRVLLIEHPTLGLWLQPGGHIEPGDLSPREGAQREVREETGLIAELSDVLFDIDVHTIPARGSAPAHLHFDLRFLAQLPDAVAPSGDEDVAAEWFTLEQAMERTTDGSVHRMIGKVRSERARAW